MKLSEKVSPKINSGASHSSFFNYIENFVFLGACRDLDINWVLAASYVLLRTVELSYQPMRAVGYGLVLTVA